MQFDFGVSGTPSPTGGPPSADGATELLRQILEAQRETLQVYKAMMAAMDHNARWRALLNRWREEFPTLPEGARQALPVLEKAYGGLLSNLVEELRDKGQEGLDNEFALQDFLDRYGMRLSQMSQILNLVSPLAEFVSQNESS
jgi:hypothetical protein